MIKLGDLVRSVAPHCKPQYLDGFDQGDASGLFETYGINNPLRVAHFLAQFAGETGGGVVLYESGDYKSVARLMKIFGAGRHSAAITESEAAQIVAMPMPEKEHHLFERVYGSGNPHMAKILGNSKEGDGWLFRGTGVLQSTGRGAAHQWGDRIGVSFEANPELMIAPKYVMMPPLMEWSAGRLNESADRNDARHIRKTINGGYNGYDECVAWFHKFYAKLSSDDPAVVARPSETTSLLQLQLNQIGFQPPLVVDGKYGPKTKQAVEWFQKLAGVQVDGIAGIVTKTALMTKLMARRAGVPTEEETT